MPSSTTVEIAKHTFELLADRGLYDPERETLFVADTHFGKEATFRRHGVPVPVGSTDATLNAIERMIQQRDIKELTILGDMFHAPSSLSRDVVHSLNQFFDRLPHMSFTLIRGNHDAGLGPFPTQWPITVREPIVVQDRVALGHHPDTPPDGADIYLCGHLHPSIRLGTRHDRTGKLPCFWFRRGCLVLPAIGDFTGTHLVDLKASDRAWVVADGHVYPHPNTT